MSAHNGNYELHKKKKNKFHCIWFKNLKRTQCRKSSPIALLPLRLSLPGRYLTLSQNPLHPATPRQYRQMRIGNNICVYIRTLQWIRRLFAGLLLQNPVFETRLVDLGFVVDNVALERISHRLIRFPPISIVPPLLYYTTSDRTMALGSTQPLTEMSTKSISRG